ncbi:CBASS cGAMP synthase [Gilvimarinus algae]|uniref:Cyclic GMP-AMP synthase n=1 Tax=Gilvimarinus algae TaxID=3058037 RepID=A0ABT8TE70_9GAMM|nr:CBASS cGAMP synthase [Gilvimarinus sp. SDUM040014]MDO3382397.1 CBASS cGAMP synthase [Gilvimarinus sp. SDUM040014]
MTWDFHNFFNNRKDGLVSKLLLSEAQKNELKKLRGIVRRRTKEIFEEAQSISREIGKNSLSLEMVEQKFNRTKIQYLSKAEKNRLAKLLLELSPDAKMEFDNLIPRFATQGSFQYDTLNRPYYAKQEMDIDDGTYMPMTIFKGEPRIGHTILLLLVDASLKSLESENEDWKFEAKQTCGRISIKREKTHIDVPMYAIPIEQFIQKEQAFCTMNEMRIGAISYSEFSDRMQEKKIDYEVDAESVNLALREGDKRWTNSDPKIVEKWFSESCARIGSQLRYIVRYMKAWRDAQWDVGGPSSICLMAACVNILNKEPCDESNMWSTIKLLAEKLPAEFENGIESPDSTDEKPLFLPKEYHGDFEKGILDKIKNLSGILNSAENAKTKDDALKIISEAFGDRVKNSEIIVSASASAAFQQDPDAESKPETISVSMKSGI